MPQKLLLVTLGFGFLFYPLGCKRETRHVLVENRVANEVIVNGQTLAWKGNATFFVHFLQTDTPCEGNVNDLEGSASTEAQCKVKPLPLGQGLISYSYVITPEKLPSSTRASSSSTEDSTTPSVHP